MFNKLKTNLVDFPLLLPLVDLLPIVVHNFMDEVVIDKERLIGIPVELLLKKNTISKKLILKIKNISKKLEYLPQTDETTDAGCR